ncbi:MULTISPECIES: radical SAM protein [unclassified Fusibacter]|uniref:SPL family radical SAM protein n=1 Tax=unclassified Fusibacter TaxID=2624464 RepID=UPI001012EE70|nr:MULTISPECIES: radical SAM protein [unclassified Fusibacter]MCK8060599.1 radical SAM protein [Fusibacter sp. A2]NPE22947.1 radical SAM protein [Fusibacter sp. A1]RXV60014.1 radical SAM protein [Fusibacter sp. A1]
MIQLVQSKSYLNKRKDVDTWFMSKYKIAPYAGCSHNCAYCDGRSEKYYFDGVFGKDLFVRYDCANSLVDEIRTASEKGPIMIGSGYTDAYQPIEKKFNLTRNILINALPHHKQHAAVVLTKSDLILKDLDILKAWHQHKKVMVMFSLTTDDDNLTSWLEPGASSASARLKAIETLTKEGIPVGVAAMPFIPYLNDRNQPLISFLKRLKDAGVSFVLPGSLTLRPGENKDHFAEVLAQHQPDLTSKILSLYREDRPSGMPVGDYESRFTEHLTAAMNHAGLVTRAPHHLTKDWFTLYDSVTILLSHMSVLYASDEKAISRIRDLSKMYEAWLESASARIGRPKDRYVRLEQELEHIIRNPLGLDDSFDDKFRQFILPLLDHKVYDYQTKKWL